MKSIYLDNAATTRMLPEVKQEIIHSLGMFGNPSSHYDLGIESKNRINEARGCVSSLINAKPSEIYFTSGGTEADNWALISGFLANKDKGNRIITTKIEHHAILNTCKFLEEYLGAEVIYLDVDKMGIVNLDELKENLSDNTVIVSVMMANNEIGTVQPIKEISEIVHSYNKDILFHSDCVQALGHIPIDVNELGIDLLSSSAHKLGGPKGVGCLFIKDGITLPPYIHGGGQEKGMRASTENILGIIGFGKAAEIAKKNMADDCYYVRRLRDYLTFQIVQEIPNVRINGSWGQRLPGNINATFIGIRAETLLVLLNDCGIFVSTGSACNSDSIEASHVLKAIGLSEEESNATVRFSLSTENNYDEIDYIVSNLKRCVEQLRRI